VIGDIERKDLDQRDIYAGTLATAEGDTVAFLAVGSTGTLVRRSAATLCGVVLGTTERRVMLVGMFDLPENKQRAVARPEALRNRGDPGVSGRATDSQMHAVRGDPGSTRSRPRTSRQATRSRSSSPG